MQPVNGAHRVIRSIMEIGLGHTVTGVLKTRFRSTPARDVL